MNGWLRSPLCTCCLRRIVSRMPGTRLGHSLCIFSACSASRRHPSYKTITRSSLHSLRGDSPIRLLDAADAPSPRRPFIKAVKGGKRSAWHG
eukprot:scaffold121006_cov69-Phaeocystis_antarctica.AAC.3